MNISFHINIMLPYSMRPVNHYPIMSPPIPVSLQYHQIKRGKNECYTLRCPMICSKGILPSLSDTEDKFMHMIYDSHKLAFGFFVAILEYWSVTAVDILNGYFTFWCLVRTRQEGWIVFEKKLQHPEIDKRQFQK